MSAKVVVAWHRYARLKVVDTKAWTGRKKVVDTNYMKKQNIMLDFSKPVSMLSITRQTYHLPLSGQPTRPLEEKRIGQSQSMAELCDLLFFFV
jgi:hypothetical protein